MHRIDMYDTTLRDGSQGEGVNFSLQDKLLITQKLDEVGMDFIEGGYPLSNPKDMAYFEEVQRLPLHHAKIVAFGMTRRKGIRAADDVGMKALVQSRAPVVTIVGKTWDLHVREVLRVDQAENLAMIGDSLRFCREAGEQRVFYDAEHFFDGLRYNREFALQTLRAAQEAGAEVIILCDTNGGSLPEWIAEATALAKRELSVPLGIHGHNDGDLATANTLAAIQAGATQVQGTINGIGERCGNTDLLCVIPNLLLKMGYQALSPDKIRRLTELSRYVYELANMNFRNNQPFVGSSAFAHKGGMHVHAVERNPHSYEHIDPETVGNERRVLVSELAGQSNVLALGEAHQLTRDQAVRVLNRVQDLENEGYQFEAAAASFDLLIRKELGSYRPFFEPKSFRVNTEQDFSTATPVSEATVKLVVGGRVEHTVAEGDGPVNALDGALRKALEPVYEALKTMRLVDYKVRVVNPRAGTAARVRVTIESQDGDDVWGTVGVHENIIEASWQALVDSIEYKLFKANLQPV